MRKGPEARASAEAWQTRRLSQILGFALLCSAAAFAQIPITELGQQTYTGNLPGGLYLQASNEMPSDHAAAGIEQVAKITPRARDGRTHPDGKIVLLSIGNHVALEGFGAFVRLTSSDPRVNRQTLVILGGAAAEQPEDWDAAADPAYEQVRRSVLMPAGITEAQVQVIWLQVAKPAPEFALPVQHADAYRLKTSLGSIARALKRRYPNLQLLYVSSSIYGGYAGLEPFAYETAFGVRFIIEDQIQQIRTGYILDVRPGDLDYRKGVAPWLAWGPYLWANGSTPRVDGMSWNPEDFEWNGARLSATGKQKMGQRLLDFFRTEPTARSWFLAQAPLRARPARR